MCLLVVCSRVVPGIPLVVAANRDERLDRPATAITLLRAAGPAILGGRDELAGGSWLTVNEEGVVAGLTNRPAPAGRDPRRRSRGELPLLLASRHSATEAVAAFSQRVDPAQYNPAWLLVGDRRSLFYLELSGSARRRSPEELPAGIHILENLPLGVASEKVERARAVLGEPSTLRDDNLLARFHAVLSDHQLLAPATGGEGAAATGGRRPACVHGATYGTRSSAIIVVREDERPIEVLVADGRPCTTEFHDETSRWPKAPGVRGE